MICASFVFGQSTRKDPPLPKFSELSPNDSVQLDQQRRLIAAVVKQRFGKPSLTGTKADLPVLQKLIDDHVFNKSQTYELQSLGVVFGHVLTSEFPLKWVMISDEYGTDPTLRFKSTTVNLNALTMISKRIERNEPVNLLELVGKTRDVLSHVDKRAQ